MRMLIVGAGTMTATIEGISAAGIAEEAMYYTPSADLEIVAYGNVTRAPTVPISPSGCPTPAVVTRAARELVGFEVTALDAGLCRSTGAPTVSLGDQPGDDIRTDEPVANAAELFATARRFGKRLPDAGIFIGETIPGGTTTAMAVLTALGERSGVSSSFAHNPLALKREVIDEALRASGLEAGNTAGEPIKTVRRVGDPMLGAVAGLIVGATERGIDVTLAGGTQLAGAAALARHAGVDAPLSLSTTSFVAADETAAIDGLAHDLELDLSITDPAFQKRDHSAVNGYVTGEAKEGVGMGGALAMLDGTDGTMSDLYERITAVYDRLMAADSASGRSLDS